MSRIYQAFQAQKQAIRRIVRKYRSNPADVEDLTQDVFLAAFAAEQKTTIHQPEHLLLKIAKNLALNEVKRKVNSTFQSIEDLPIMSVIQDERQSTPERILDGKQKLVIFAEALSSLPPELRRAFVLRHVEGLKIKQIAIRMNVSVSTVEKRVAAAMLQCHRYLKSKGHDPADFSAAPKKQTVKKRSNVSKFPEADDRKV